MSPGSGGNGGDDGDGRDRGARGADVGADPDTAADGERDPSALDDRTAVESLEQLGLSNYEARVFVALQRLGVATAREVHETAEVPRSQVYGAAEALEERGLVELQQSTPKRYRPVSLAAAEERLASRLDRERDRAFDHLERVRQEGTDSESRDDVWTVRGSGAVTDRIVALAKGAERRLLFGTPDPALLSEELVGTLRSRAEAGVEVRVVSESPAVREALAPEPFPTAAPRESSPSDGLGRMLLVDDDTVLLSVRSDPATGGDAADETAIWSAETTMASVLVRIVRGSVEKLIGDPTDGDGNDTDGDGREEAGSNG
jgi:sugar-specific transcriptional regulator TrmB